MYVCNRKHILQHYEVLPFASQSRDVITQSLFEILLGPFLSRTCTATDKSSYVVVGLVVRAATCCFKTGWAKSFSVCRLEMKHAQVRCHRRCFQDNLLSRRVARRRASPQRLDRC